MIVLWAPLKKTSGKCYYFWNCLLESYSIMQYSKVFVQTVLEIKVVSISEQMWRSGGKQVFPDTCSFKFVSCFNVFNHILEYCNVLTKLSVLNSKCNLTIRNLGKLLHAAKPLLVWTIFFAPYQPSFIQTWKNPAVVLINIFLLTLGKPSVVKPMYRVVMVTC